MSTELKYYRAILVLEGTTQEQYDSGYAQALLDIEEKYNPENPNFVGDFELKQFKKANEAWDKENQPTRKFSASSDDIEHINFMLNLASVPTNFVDADTKVVILGPELNDELDIHVNELTEIK